MCSSNTHHQDSPRKDSRGSTKQLYRANSSKQYKAPKVSIRASATPPPSPTMDRNSSSESDSEDTEPGKMKKKIKLAEFGYSGLTPVGEVDPKKGLENLEVEARPILLDKKRRSSASPYLFDKGEKHKMSEDLKKERTKEKERAKERIKEKVKEDRDKKVKDAQISERHSHEEIMRHPEKNNGRPSLPGVRLSIGKSSPSILCNASPNNSPSGGSPIGSPHAVDTESKGTISEMDDTNKGQVQIQKVKASAHLENNFFTDFIFDF